MKIYQLIIFAILFIYIQHECATTSNINRRQDCNTRYIGVAEELFGSKYCCYVYGTSGNEEMKRCTPITQNEYNNMTTTINYYQKKYSMNIKSFHCKSSYIQIGLLALLFIFF